MSIEYIQRTYKVPAKIGGRVEYTGDASPRMGTITGTDGATLLIKLDGNRYSRRYHPMFKLEYLEAAS